MEMVDFRLVQHANTLTGGVAVDPRIHSRLNTGPCPHLILFTHFFVCLFFALAKQVNGMRKSVKAEIINGIDTAVTLPYAGQI